MGPGDFYSASMEKIRQDIFCTACRNETKRLPYSVWLNKHKLSSDWRLTYWRASKRGLGKKI